MMGGKTHWIIEMKLKISRLFLGFLAFIDKTDEDRKGGRETGVDMQQLGLDHGLLR